MIVGEGEVGEERKGKEERRKEGREEGEEEDKSNQRRLTADDGEMWRRRRRERRQSERGGDGRGGEKSEVERELVGNPAVDSFGCGCVWVTPPYPTDHHKGSMLFKRQCVKKIKEGNIVDTP
jgi:hypothetical protein